MNDCDDETHDSNSSQCTICDRPAKRPKLLPCEHCFCLGCLESYIPDESLSVTCPTCRQTSILPQDGVLALPNIDVSETNGENGMDRISELIENGDEVDDSLKNGAGNLTNLELDCSLHNLELTLHCRTCSKAICTKCSQSEHFGHDFAPLDENRQELETFLKNLLDDSRQKAKFVRQSLSKVESVSATLNSHFTEAETQLLDTFQHLSDLLEIRKEKLLSDLRAMHEKKQEKLSSQITEFAQSAKDLELCYETGELALRQADSNEMFKAKQELTERLKLLSPSKKSLLPEENDFLFFFDKDIRATEKHVSNFGKVRSNSAVSFETTASGDGLKQCYTNVPTSVTVTTKDCGSDLVTVGYAVISAQMKQHSKDNSSMNVEISDNFNGTYDVIYTTNDNRPYDLDIFMMGQHIKGSPFYILSVPKPDGLSVAPAQAKSRSKSKTRSSRRSSSRSRSQGRKNTLEDDLVLKIGRKGRNRGEFMNPQGVYACTNKYIVADSNSQCVQVIHKDGSVLLKFGIRGRNPGQMQRPICPAITVNGNYLISDYDNGCVSVFNPEGKYLNKFGTGRLMGPKGIAVNKIGQIVVVDNKNSCIFVFQSNGRFSHKFGSRGNADFQLAGPHYVAIGDNNEIIVSDFHNHCIKMFSAEGGYLYSFGSNGEGNGQFNAPTGVATDTVGNILVADWGNSRVQVFDSTGSFLSYINTTADPLYGPQGISVTNDGHVIVADTGNHCLKVYKYLQ